MDITLTMNNQEIASYLKSIKNFSTSLWDKPRPKWTIDDFKELKNLTAKSKGKNFGRPKGIPAHNKKKIMRLSDGKIYNSFLECEKDKGNPRNGSLSLAFKGQKRYKGILTRFKLIEDDTERKS